MTDIHAISCCCYDCTPGFKATATRVKATLWRRGDAEPDPQYRKVELFPWRYDNRPLHVRAMERRVER